MQFTLRLSNLKPYFISHLTNEDYILNRPVMQDYVNSIAANSIKLQAFEQYWLYCYNITMETTLKSPSSDID